MTTSSSAIRRALGALLLTISALNAQVVINELHYDPESKTEPVEFIELYNASAEAVDLSGWQFSNGIDYTFPAGSSLIGGAYLVIAENIAAYNSKFGSIFVGGLRASGEFAEGSSLSNDGERVALRDDQGGLIDDVNYGVGFPWPTASQGEPDPDTGDGVSMELIHPSLDNDLGGSWRAAERAPTPGKMNSVFAESNQIAPLIRQVRHRPKAPMSGEQVVVTAKVTDSDGVSSVELDYQGVEPGNYIRIDDEAYNTAWETLAMSDDGVAPDELAEDGIYSVAMPESLQTHRHLTRYRFRVEDTTGNRLQVPYADDPQPNFAYFTYDGVPAWSGAISPGETPDITFSAETMNSIAVYHLIATRDDVERQQWGGGSSFWNGTVVYDGEVYDHMRFSKRGRASLGQVGKEKWDWNFNRGHRFQARDNYGKRYEVKWREINILPGTNPWWANDVSTDGTILNEAVGFRMFQLIGSPASNTNFFQMRVISQASEAPNDQYEGDLWGLYNAIQDPDNRFLRERGLPDGNVYNWHGAGVKKNQGATAAENDSDYRAFTSALRRTTPLETWQELLNFDAYYSFNLGNLIVNNSDMRPGENMMSYIHPDGRTHPIPWDLDLTFEAAPHLGRGDTPAWENLYHVLSHDSVDAGYQSRAREILDLLFNGDQSDMLVDEYSRFIWVDVPESSKLSVLSLTKAGSTAIATTAEPHGFETGDLVSIDGAEEAVFNGDKSITKVSDTAFSYKDGLTIFTPAPGGGNVVAFKSPDAKPLVLADQAIWDHHPRKRKKGIYYKNIKGITTENFKGYQAYMKKFVAPGGYGHDLVSSHIEPKLAANTPTITYTGSDGFSLDDLSFEVSEFDGNGTIFAPQKFAALQWRLAEITDRSSDDFDPNEPRKYEIEADWQSEPLTTFDAAFTFPNDAARVGRTYRVRARMLADNGHWSHWSDAIQFVASGSDVSGFADSLVVTEIMFNPGETSEIEKAANYGRSDFEFIELKNIGNAAIDLTEVRFTKGIDFDFVGGAVTSLAPGAFVLVVSDLAAFEQRYGNGLPVAGMFETGQLSNGGELLKLSLGAGTPIREFTYGDDLDWPASADGEGYSLTLASVASDSDLNVATSWKASSAINGSPGADDDGEPVGPEPGATWANWAETIFTDAEQADVLISGPNADPDGDGRSNVLEYGLATSPKEHDADAALTVTAADPVSLQHPWVVADDLAYSIERSTDLMKWVEVPDLTAEVQGSHRIVTLVGPQVAETYYRLRVGLQN